MLRRRFWLGRMLVRMTWVSEVRGLDLAIRFALRCPALLDGLSIRLSAGFCRNDGSCAQHSMRMVPHDVS